MGSSEWIYSKRRVLLTEPRSSQTGLRGEEGHMVADTAQSKKLPQETERIQ